MITSQLLVSLYRRAYNRILNSSGVPPLEAFDELLKYLFFKQINEVTGPPIVIPFELSSDDSCSPNQRILAKKIRSLFARYVSTMDPWSKHIWKDKCFYVNDSTLLLIHRIFEAVCFRHVSFDTRSKALKESMPADVRRDWGINLTPDDVVRMMVHFVSPPAGSTVLNLAVGSGAFLIETLKHWRRQSPGGRYEVWGVDKNPRMLLLANLHLKHSDCMPHLRLMDSLSEASPVEQNQDWPKPNTVDYIFAEPPLGTFIDGTFHDLSTFTTCRESDGRVIDKQQSDVLFLERALTYLKPGGTVAIVLSDSLATETSLKNARKALSNLGYIFGLVALPPETFQTAGTQANAMLLFAHKYKRDEDRHASVRICFSGILSAGYDSAGRARKGNELLLLTNDMLRASKGERDIGGCQLLPEICRKDAFSLLPQLLSSHPIKKKYSKKSLGNYVTLVCNGRTPAKSRYAGKGLFVVKVGNITGNGINWTARERNYVDGKEMETRKASEKLMLRDGDILLTSTAHSPEYIAKKVDIVWNIPEWVGGMASFVREIMLIRINPEMIDPFMMLAYLRSPSIMAYMQSKVKGQAAHLHPDDILDLPIPEAVMSPDENARNLAGTLRKNTEQYSMLNQIMYQNENSVICFQNCLDSNDSKETSEIP